MKRKENGAPPDQKAALLNHFRRVANSNSQDKCDKAYSSLKASVFWQNPQGGEIFCVPVDANSENVGAVPPKPV